MIEENGQVVAVEEGYAWVETQRSSSCGSCSAKGCGTGALSKVLGNKPLRVRVANRIDARVGDAVVLGLSEQALVRGSLAAYIVPLLAMLAGALAGETMAGNLGITWADGFTALCGLLGLGGGMLWLAAFSRRAARDGAFQPVLLRQAGGAVAAVKFPG